MARVSKSFSALEQFILCERQYYFRRVLRLPEEPSHYLAIGSYYHEAFALWAIFGRVEEVDLKAMLAAHKVRKEWMCPTADHTLIEEVMANLARMPKFEAAEDAEGLMVERWGRRFYTARIDLVSEKTPLVEHGRITGWLDRPCVVDWKVKFSARKKRDQESTDNSAQLALYCIEAGVNDACFVEIPRDVALPVNVLVAHFDDESLAGWRRYFDAQFAAMSARGDDEAAYRLAPRGHPLCCSHWCQFWKRCPGGEGDRS